MPTFLMQLRWTPLGFQNLTDSGGAQGAQYRRRSAKTLVRGYGSPGTIKIKEIKDTLTGPDWIVVAPDLNTLNTLTNPNNGWDSHGYVNTTIFQIGDEAERNE